MSFIFSKLFNVKISSDIFSFVRKLWPDQQLHETQTASVRTNSQSVLRGAAADVLLLSLALLALLACQRLQSSLQLNLQLTHSLTVYIPAQCDITATTSHNYLGSRQVNLLSVRLRDTLMFYSSDSQHQWWFFKLSPKMRSWCSETDEHQSEGN